MLFHNSFSARSVAGIISPVAVLLLPQLFQRSLPKLSGHVIPDFINTQNDGKVSGKLKDILDFQTEYLIPEEFFL